MSPKLRRKYSTELAEEWNKGYQHGLAKGEERAKNTLVERERNLDAKRLLLQGSKQLCRALHDLIDNAGID